MMMTAAGGPGMVSPIDFHERRTPRSTRAIWIAIGVVSAAHIGVGYVLYQQRFELASPPVVDAPPVTTITMERPEPKPLPVKPTPPQPPASNTRTNPLPADPTTTDTVSIVSGDIVAESTTITTQTVIDDPAPEGTATQPQPPVPPTPVIRSPSWISKPNARQMENAYPSRALEAGIGGSATLNCLVLTTGQVGDCQLVRETPTGEGFGRAAQTLSRHFRLNPRTVNGTAQGSRVIVALRFDPPVD